jgi:ribonuclease Z
MAEDHLHKSFGYKLVQSRRKIKPEYMNLSGMEIKHLRETMGDDLITMELIDIILAYSGDTPVENASQWDGAQVLIHEATFIEADKKHPVEQHGNRHSTLEGVIEMVSKINIGTLILGHFSSRYDSDFIKNSIIDLCKHYKLKCPVHAVLPGRIHSNILSTEALYNPS